MGYGARRNPFAELAWLEEAERRLDELESRKITATPAEQVLKKTRSTLR